MLRETGVQNDEAAPATWDSGSIDRRAVVLDRIDRYGRLLRYVVRTRDNLNVNVYLVRIGAATPYFYGGTRGRFANLLERLARRARARHLGLWGTCPHTSYDPDRAVATRR